MLIINIETRGYKTLHYGQPPDGWLPIPHALEPRARAYCPYCELIIEDGMLVDITPLPRPEPEPAPPSELQLLGQSITDEQLARIEMGQTYTDLELSILGGIANV